jgi:hypothetical protein
VIVTTLGYLTNEAILEAAVIFVVMEAATFGSDSTSPALYCLIPSPNHLVWTNVGIVAGQPDIPKSYKIMANLLAMRVMWARNEAAISASFIALPTPTLAAALICAQVVANVVEACDILTTTSGMPVLRHDVDAVLTPMTETVRAWVNDVGLFGPGSDPAALTATLRTLFLRTPTRRHQVQG